MSFEEFMEQAGITKDDLKEFISPVVKESVAGELNEVIVGALTPFIETIRQEMSTQISVRVAEQFNALGFDKFDPNKLAEDIKKMSDEKLERVIAEGKQNPNKEGEGTISEEMKVKWMDKLLTRVLGGDEDELMKVAERFSRTTDAMSRAAVTLGYSPPNPMMIYKIYMDAYARNYAAMMRAGVFPRGGGTGLPLPVVDRSKKNSAPSSPLSASQGNTSSKPTAFDQFL